MINFTKRYVNTVSLILSIIIFCLLNNFIIKNFISNEIQVETNQIQNYEIKSETKKNQTKENKKEVVQEANWQIEIPQINLKAEISEGTTKEIMDKYVGHFEETKKDKGNIGLAAHNRGYKVNYFQDLKKLKEGDEVIYKYNGKQRKYTVKTLKIIKDTDWSLLENTKDNRITLITCVENEPEYRRCIQAIEKI